MNTPEIVQQFVTMYQTLNKDNLHLLQTVYSEDICFIDALHEVSGLDQLAQYFAAMYGNLLSAKIHVTDVQCCQSFDESQRDQEGVAYLSWVMQYAHPRLAGGKVIRLDGVTQIRFTDKVTYHRDYADMGQMLYEHIPLLGPVIRLIKRRAVS